MILNWRNLSYYHDAVLKSGAVYRNRQAAPARPSDGAWQLLGKASQSGALFLLEPGHRFQSTRNRLGIRAAYFYVDVTTASLKRFSDILSQQNNEHRSRDRIHKRPETDFSTHF